MRRNAARSAQGQTLRELYEAGHSVQDIAEQTAASAASIYRALVAAGTTFRTTPVAPLGSPERAELARTVREGYDAGLTQSEVARSIGCDHDTARRLITEAGGTIRTRVMNGLDEYTRPLLAKRLRMEYENGASLADLSAALDCRESSVRCLLVEAGATIRPLGSRCPPRAQSSELMGLRQLATWLGWEPPKKRQPPRPVTEQDARRIVASYLSGDTMERLAADTGYPYSRVRRTLLAAGVEIRSNRLVPKKSTKS